MRDPHETSPFGESFPCEIEAQPELPSAIGRYRVEKLLGEGGFGRVYRAYDDQLQRSVAIKVPRRERLTRPKDAEAYLAEARILASLDHPNIVPVHDVGMTSDGLCYVVSKLIEGADLARTLRETPLAHLQTAGLLATVASALHSAHGKGLVHRDIKPGNILLDTTGIPYVADFGIALTEENYGKGGGLLGTPEYMSPEQARGEGHRVDGRSDIFSLGVVFYELLLGRRPFLGETLDELLKNISNADPRPPRQIDDTIPKELERICLKALSKRASERYTTAKDLADDLRHWCSAQTEVRVPAEGGLQTAAPVVDSVLEAASGLGKDAFLSYASGDRQAAFRLCQLLEEQGIGCWIAPRDVNPGANYAEAIIRAIEVTTATVLLLSEHANASIHVVHEVERATNKRKRVIPVRLKDVLPGPKLELHLASAQWLDAWRLPLEQVATQLSLVVRGEQVSTAGPQDTKPPITPVSDQRPLKIVPKGLRSFDAHDADFFLELVPGPRDRDGLPESIRFWKTRIEETDADQTFSVGLIYGPSGCGKSSLVKAGLLPRLSDQVISVYIESTAEETESRLLNGLRKRCPELPAGQGLKEAIAALRREPGLSGGKKVLIVLDQFEQWLHAKKEESHPELVQASRQCDGARVQCVVMVRDDFWMAATRFMRDLEVRLVEAQNSAAVDLFDPDHARKVLSAFGRAFGKFPESSRDASKDQKQFVELVVSGLSQEGKVISVRLALFAEMVKGKPWTPATLKEVGGTAGIGVTFLEETFTASTAPPQHRLHQKAAQAVLKALLPEAATDIKGHMRSRQELLEASGYASRPRDFDELLRILDGEIRLITPTDPEGKTDTDPSTLQAGAQYYQLTHDYLVPSLRDWLTRKQKETRRGRAELLLADRAAVWNARPENRQLPSLWQWCQIRLLTAKRSWTPPQRKMMRKTARFHALRAAALAVLLVAGTVTGLSIRAQIIEQNNVTHATGLVQRLIDAETAQVPAIIAEMVEYRPWVDPLLREANEKTPATSRHKLPISLALLPVDANQIDYLCDWLLSAEPQEVPVLRDALEPHADAVRDRLWAVMEAPEKLPRLRAAAALAKYDPGNDKWAQVSPMLVSDVVLENPVFLGQWSEAFRPVRQRLLGPLTDIFRDQTVGRAAERALATNLLANYAADQPRVLADLLMDADEKQFAVIYQKLRESGEQGSSVLTAEVDRKIPSDANDDDKEKLAKRQANAAVALLKMDQSARFWPLLKHSPDPRVRSYLIHRLGPLGADAQTIIARLDNEPDVSTRRALILSLGSFGTQTGSIVEAPIATSVRDRAQPLTAKQATTQDQFAGIDQDALAERLFKVYEHDPDSGMHAAAEWLLRRWGHEDRLKALKKRLRIKEADLQATLTAPRTDEQKQLAAKVQKIQDELAAAERERPKRQAAWEQALRDRNPQLPEGLARGLLAHYALDEGEGAEARNSVKGQPAASFDGEGRPHWVAGVLGRAVNLSGQNHWVGGKPFDREADHPFSYGCWFRYDAPIPMIILSTRDGAKGYRGFDLSLEENHQLRVQIAGEDPKLADKKRQVYSPSVITVFATTSVDPRRRPGWQHAFVTYDGSRKARGVAIYVDGARQPTEIRDDAFAGTMKGDAPLRLGSRAGTYHFRGALDDVRVYDRRLSDDEVKQLFDAGILALARTAADERYESQRTLLAEAFRGQDEASAGLIRALGEARAALAKAGGGYTRGWYINGEGQTMVVIPGPVEFVMGSPATEVDRRPDEAQHKMRIGRTFALAAAPVTREQFLRYRKAFEHTEMRRYPTPDCPIGGVTWFEAAAYCNWLSERECLPREQWCYEVDGTGQVMALKGGYLSLAGYRLPTEAEMEYATRAGAITARHFGETEELLPRYAWCSKNSQERTWPVGTLNPNDFGLFDTHSNVFSWCQESYKDTNRANDDKEDPLVIDRLSSRVLRGGSFLYPASLVRSASRNYDVPTARYNDYGIRPSRTLPLYSFTALPTPEGGRK